MKTIKNLFEVKIIKYWIWWWLAALIDLGLLYLFTDIVWIYYLYSTMLAFLISVIFAYLFQKYITFHNKSNKHISQIFSFISLQITWQIIYTGIIRLWTNTIFSNYFVVAIFAKFIVFIRNFVSNSYLTFKK